MKRMRISMLALIGAAALLAGHVQAAGRRPAVLLVVPAREALVSLAFDLARLGNTDVASYRIKNGAPVLFAWDRVTGQWHPIGQPDYQAGTPFQLAPRHAVVVGTNAADVAALSDGLAWAGKVQTVTTYAFADIINRVNELSPLTEREWRDLAARRGLTLRDENAERRRWGKYGPPEKKQPAAKSVQPAPIPETGTLPPIETLDEPAPAPATPAPKAMPVAEPTTATVPVNPADK